MAMATLVRAQTYMTLMSYNCENAFDTIHDEGKNDYEYLPQSESSRWTSGRMWRKLRRISQVIMAVDTLRPVDIVCLVEVENDSVMQWLTRRTALQSIGYEYVMTHSPDRRGIDVALIYQPMTFRPLTVDSIRIAEQGAYTRDILHVSGRIVGGDTLDVYAVHLPSKRGRAIATRRRKVLLTQLCDAIDSLYKCRRDALVVVMGDFNDAPTSSVIRQTLGRTGRMVNLMEGRRQGTYKFRGHWDCIDHIWVSSSMLEPGARVSTSMQESGVLTHPMLLERDPIYGGMMPRRTYLNMRYNGGYSDHLPVWMRLGIRY